MAQFPDGKQFAFTVFDDTDGGTQENLEPVYRLLANLGFHTTKSVWPLPSAPGVPGEGETLEDAKYLRFVHWLLNQGFEISLHNVRCHDSLREVVADGLQRFRELVGHYPITHTNHYRNRDNLYAGSDRIRASWLRGMHALTTRFRQYHYYKGHVNDSPFFWGDLCREHVRYVRNLVFDEINLDRINPTMPYHDPWKPFVANWFSSSEGANAASFCRMICEENQDRLEAEGGVCIMYTHFSRGFLNGPGLNPLFERLMRRLSQKNGWFVPVATLLNYLQSQRGERHIDAAELAAMERRWFLSKLYRGSS